MIEIETLIGKPIVVYDKQNRRREVGTIAGARLDREGIHIHGRVSDPSLTKFVRDSALKDFKIGAGE